MTEYLDALWERCLICNRTEDQCQREKRNDSAAECPQIGRVENPYWPDGGEVICCIDCHIRLLDGDISRATAARYAKLSAQHRKAEWRRCAR